MQTVLYEGSFYNNKRSGMGMSFYENGVVSFKGLWKDNEMYEGSYLSQSNIQSRVLEDGVFEVDPSTFHSIDMYSSILSSIHIADGSCNDECFSKLVIMDLPNVKEIVFGKNCCSYVRFCVMTRLPSLEALRVSKDSFTRCDHHHNAPNRNGNEERIMRENRGLSIVDCGQLSQCIFDVGCFSDYLHFTLERRILWR